VYCTVSRARKVTASMLLVSIAASAALYILWFLATSFFYTPNISSLILFKVILPFCVFVINMIVVREVRRASNNAAVNLGLQQHHQSTSSNSVVPTVMLVTTSLIYVILSSAHTIFNAFTWFTPETAFSPATRYVILAVRRVADAAHNLVFSYNFYVYLITGKQFRCELHKLFCRCRSAAPEAAGDAARLPRRAYQAETPV